MKTADLDQIVLSPEAVREALALHPTSENVYRMVALNDSAALRMLLGQIKSYVWNILPADLVEDHATWHLWQQIARKLNPLCPPAIAPADLPSDVVLQLAVAGKFDVVPYEVKHRLIDETRKASAMKRGGDREHIPQFGELSFDGEPVSARDDDDEGDEQLRSGLITARDLDGIWLQTTSTLRRQELATLPQIKRELGEGPMKVLRFYLEQPAESSYRITQSELALDLGMTDRTVRKHRTRIIRSPVREYFK